MRHVVLPVLSLAVAAAGAALADPASEPPAKDVQEQPAQFSTIASQPVEGLRLDVILLEGEYEASSQAWILLRVVNEGEAALQLWGWKAGLPFFHYDFTLVEEKTKKEVPLTRFGERVLKALVWTGSAWYYTLEPGASVQFARPIGRFFDISESGKYRLSVEVTLRRQRPSYEKTHLTVPDIPLTVVAPKPPPLPKPEQPATAEAK